MTLICSGRRQNLAYDEIVCHGGFLPWQTDGENSADICLEGGAGQMDGENNADICLEGGAGQMNGENSADICLEGGAGQIHEK